MNMYPPCEGGEGSSPGPGVPPAVPALLAPKALWFLEWFLDNLLLSSFSPSVTAVKYVLGCNVRTPSHQCCVCQQQKGHLCPKEVKLTLLIFSCVFCSW